MSYKNECICPTCGRDVWPTEQYMIGHDITADGRVIHTVTHLDCLTVPEQGRLPKNLADGCSHHASQEEQDANGER